MSLLIDFLHLYMHQLSKSISEVETMVQITQDNPIIESESSIQEEISPAQIQETDPNNIDQHLPGAKLDAGKLRPYLVLHGFKNAMYEVYGNGTFGANKYTDYGWTQVPNAKERYLDAAFRHFDRYERTLDPNNRDQDSKTHHLGAMAWNILAVLELELQEVKK